MAEPGCEPIPRCSQSPRVLSMPFERGSQLRGTRTTDGGYLPLALKPQHSLSRGRRMRVCLPETQQTPPLWHGEAGRSLAQKALFIGDFGHPVTIARGRTFHRDFQSLTSVDPNPARPWLLLPHSLSPAPCIFLIPPR